jgi:hypothetical protein
MTESNGHPPRFSVELTGLARAQLRAIGRHAKYTGTAGEVAEAFGRILHRLSRDPRGFGEPMYRLKVMRMDVFNGTVRPLYIEYGVHDEEPVVVIRYVARMSPPPTS